MVEDKEVRNETVRFDLDEDKSELSQDLTKVSQSLSEIGYDPVNQIVGYILSGDPAYLPRHNDARNRIRRHHPDEIVSELVRYYLGNQSLVAK